MWHPNVALRLRVEHWDIWFSLSIKIERGYLAELTHRITHGSHENLPYHLLVLKLYLCLDWMYINIY